jgi:hypothetical protein
VGLTGGSREVPGRKGLLQETIKKITMMMMMMMIIIIIIITTRLFPDSSLS